MIGDRVGLLPAGGGTAQSSCCTIAGTAEWQSAGGGNILLRRLAVNEVEGLVQTRKRRDEDEVVGVITIATRWHNDDKQGATVVEMTKA